MPQGPSIAHQLPPIAPPGPHNAPGPSITHRPPPGRGGPATLPAPFSSGRGFGARLGLEEEPAGPQLSLKVGHTAHQAVGEEGHPGPVGSYDAIS